MQAEVVWSHEIAEKLNARMVALDSRLDVIAGYRLAYTNEVLHYEVSGLAVSSQHSYETDVLVRETVAGRWKPRVVIEMKLAKVTTHDAITYSQKAATHKQVHPYLRYGILIGARQHYPLPGRLFRHGAYFDFMASWVAQNPDPAESDAFVRLLQDEVSASRQLEEIMHESRSLQRRRYTILHRHLILWPPHGASTGAAELEDAGDEVTTEEDDVNRDPGIAPTSGGRLGQYRPLFDFLTAQGAEVNSVEMTLKQIADLLHGQLPPSAYKHRAWWSNSNANNTHSHARAWLQAGWRTADVSLGQQYVEFRRNS